MSTQPNPATGAAVPMTQAELEKMIGDNVSKAVGPAIEAAFAPLAQAQTDVFGRLGAALGDAAQPGLDIAAQLDDL